ncbi:lymphotoxin-alpha [Leuresthes tenuis]|uniref:lymphotoxin-alpha n=1 Tax=Leuresthes tenuis TaxID=355514 RepID=UPI003B509354
MCLREKQQITLDTESATHAGMEGRSRSCHRYLLLQVWCGFLTISVLLLVALFALNKPKSEQDTTSSQSLMQDNISRTGKSASYIQLVPTLTTDTGIDWQPYPECDSCSLRLQNKSIYCKERSHYFIYAQVRFKQESQKKSVILIRNATSGKKHMILVEVPATNSSSVWVGKIVILTENDSVSLNITGKIEKENTFWGAFQLP